MTEQYKIVYTSLLSEAKYTINNDRNRFVNSTIVEDINPTTGLISQTSIGDKFRVDIKNYWKWNQGNITQNLPDWNVPLYMPSPPQVETNDAKEKVLRFSSSDLGLNVSLRKVDEQTIESLAGYKKETYEIFIAGTEEEIGQQNPLIALKGSNWWTNWCLSSFPNANWHEDTVFSMNKPETGLQDMSRGDEVQRNFVKIKGNYNYLSLKYEKLISGFTQDALEGPSETFNELLLPNLYTYMSVVNNNVGVINSNTTTLEDDRPDPPEIISKFKNHLTLNGFLKDFDTNSLFYKQSKMGATPVTYNKFDLANNSIGNYLNVWADAAEAAALENQENPVHGMPAIVEAQIGYDNILFSEADFKIINDYNSAASMFPMNVQIQLEPERDKTVFRALKDTKYNSLMLRYIADSNNENTWDFYASNENRTKNLSTTARSLNDFLEDAKDGKLTSDDTLQKDYVYIGTDNDEYDFSAPQNSFFSKLMSLGLDSKINSTINNTARSFEQILSGDECYAETVAYEIEKWSAGGGGQLLEKIQTFYLPNDDTSMIEMFDTQVKYNKFYVYRIFAHKVVFGTIYSYNTSKDSIYDKPDGKSVLVDVTTYPVMKIIRVPYYNVDELELEVTGPGTGVFKLASHLTTLVMDDAPLPPEIEIVPMIKSPSTMLINIKDTIGSMRQFARPIEEDDTNQYEVLLEKQLKDEFNLSKEQLANINLFDNKVFFKSDEPSEYLQTFRTTTKPTSYGDFKDSEKQLLNGPNNSVKINLNFNQKYYFVFRAIDFHGKFSNPTDVYEVEIKEEDGMWFPVIRIFNIEEENKLDLIKKSKKDTNFSMSGKRFVHIKPSYHQWMMKGKYDEEDYESAFDIPDFSIGEADESVFQENRKFKIRLTSKKTGRKIDLNIRFKQRQEKIH